MRRSVLIAATVLSALAAAVSARAAEEQKVAYVEEIVVDADGTRHVQRYKPNERPVKIQGPVRDIQAPQEVEGVPPPPRQRDLNAIEKQEIVRLENDFAHGKITESEYNQRKRDIYRSTFMGGPSEDSDGLLNYNQTF